MEVDGSQGCWISYGLFRYDGPGFYHLPLDFTLLRYVRVPYSTQLTQIGILGVSWF